MDSEFEKKLKAALEMLNSWLDSHQKPSGWEEAVKQFVNDGVIKKNDDHVEASESNSTTDPHVHIDLGKIKFADAESIANEIRGRTGARYNLRDAGSTSEGVWLTPGEMLNEKSKPDDSWNEDFNLTDLDAQWFDQKDKITEYTTVHWSSFGSRRGFLDEVNGLVKDGWYVEQILESYWVLYRFINR